MQKVDAWSVNSGARGCNKCLDQNILLKTGIRNTNLMQQLYNDKDTPWGGEHIVTGLKRRRSKLGSRQVVVTLFKEERQSNRILSTSLGQIKGGASGWLLVSYQSNNLRRHMKS